MDNHTNHAAGGGDPEAFARAYPELAAAIDAAVQPEAVEKLRAARAETRRAVSAMALIFAVLLAGRTWGGWGTWSLVVLGVTGAILAGGLAQLAAYRHARIPKPEVQFRSRWGGRG